MTEPLMSGHFRVLRSHDQWRRGHEFHARVTGRRMALVRLGILELLGGSMPPVVPAVPVANPKRRRARGVEVRDEPGGDGDVRP